MNMKTRIFLAALWVVLGASLTRADSNQVDVKISTTLLQGTVGYLAFDFIGGSTVENNTVTISNFVGNATLGALTSTGNASGSISPGPGVLGDSQFFNEFLQAVTFGTTMSFTLDPTTNVSSGGIPDAFAFYLLDSTENPFATSDPTGADALFVIPISGPSLTPGVYTSPSATATVTPVTATPEPSSFWLLVVGVSSLICIRTASPLIGRRKY
jgi:hypothetical protein